MTAAYAEFLAAKKRKPPHSGITITADQVSPELFEFQRHIVAWAVTRGRAAVWADTGLGKTRIQLEWTRNVLAPGDRGLILAPLGVTAQTIREGRQIGMTVTYVRNAAEVAALPPEVVAISNYERLGTLDANVFASVVLDESSILKAYSGTTKRALVEAFKDTRFRLACTATPAPNDLEELCNQADFLGVMRPAEMRSTFFIADSRGEFMKYRIKGHAKGAFYEWLASWAIACRKPSDLGFEDDGYDLAGLNIIDHIIETDWAAEGELFTPVLKGITQRAQVRRETLSARVGAALDLICAEPDEQWIVWTGMNAESTAITKGLPKDTTAEVCGSDDPEYKASTLLAFASGDVQILVTKVRIAGYGLNFQRCARMIFVGLSDSYEQYYQAMRRCYRFGQTRQVHAHIVLADAERTIAGNVRAKERNAQSITAGLVAAIAAENRREIYSGTSKGDSFEPSRPMTVPPWLRSEVA